MIQSKIGRLRGLLVVTCLTCLLMPACTMFPAPTSPTPLTRLEVRTIVNCQKTVKRRQLAFTKRMVGALGSCLDGVLIARLSFESGLTTQEQLDAAVARMQVKCTKSYGHVEVASTRLIDAIVERCAPAEPFVLGPYDGLRFQAFFSDGGLMPATSTVELAGELCGFGVQVANLQLWETAPRLIELLSYLGPEFVLLDDMTSGLPNVPLDPRCALVAPTSIGSRAGTRESPQGP